MNYRLRSSVPGKRPVKGPLLVLAALLVVLLSVQIFAPDFASRTVLSLFSLGWKGGDAAAGLGTAAKGVAMSKGALLEENAALKKALDDARSRSAERDRLEEENAELRSLLGIAREESAVAAAVLAKPPLSPYDSIVLETTADVSVGAPIFAEGGVILGEVAEVHGRRVIGKLYSSAGTQIDAVLERTSATHRLNGIGSGNFELVIPREVDVLVGDRLMLPGVEPKVLGEVRHIETNPSDSHKKVSIISPQNIFQLKWVLIRGN